MIEEADESAYWLELLEASQLGAGASLDALLQEACELRAIFVASRATARSRIAKKKVTKKSHRNIPPG